MKFRLKILGVSLLEVVIGMTILGFTISPLIMLFVQSSKTSKIEGSRVQALFLAQKVLNEIKAGIAINPSFIYSVPTNIPFKIVRKEAFTFLSYKGARFLQQISGQDLPMTPENPFYKQYNKFSILIKNEAAGKRQYKIIVRVIWESRRKEKQVELVGLTETLPNQFTQDTE